MGRTTVRPRKNNHSFGIYEKIKLGLINYTLLGLIEHHGVFINSGIMSVTSDKVTSGTIVMINTLHKLIYSRCLIIFILCFMQKEIDVGTQVSECLAIKNVLRKQGGHKPFS